MNRMNLTKMQMLRDAICETSEKVAKEQAMTPLEIIAVYKHMFMASVEALPEVIREHGFVAAGVT